MDVFKKDHWEGRGSMGSCEGSPRALINTGYHAYEDLPKLLDPEHGYLFNTNNTPFNSAHELDNLKEEDFRQLQLGFKESENNRSARFVDLMKNQETLSMDDFYRIKYDIQYPDSIWTPSGANIVFGANRAAYPNYKVLISLIQDWDKRGDTTSVALRNGRFIIIIS